MNLIGIVIVAPIWGILSTRLFLQSWLALINTGIHVFGLVTGKVDRRLNFMGFGFSLALCLLWSGLLYLGQYLFSVVWGFGHTTPENVVYWALAIASLVFFVREFPSKIRKAWRAATVLGAIEQDILERRSR